MKLIRDNLETYELIRDNIDTNEGPYEIKSGV